jgi:hypothetical protein
MYSHQRHNFAFLSVGWDIASNSGQEMTAKIVSTKSLRSEGASLCVQKNGGTGWGGGGEICKRITEQFSLFEPILGQRKSLVFFQSKFFFFAMIIKTHRIRPSPLLSNVMPSHIHSHLYTTQYPIKPLVPNFSQ